MRHREPETVAFPDSEVLSETRTDLLIRVGGVGEKKVPKRWVSDDSEIWRKGDTGTLVLPAWYIEEYEWFCGEEDAKDDE